MKTNVKNVATPVYTHEGGKASLHVKPIDQLRRSVLSCLLWEDEFYESGASIGDRIKSLVAVCDVADVAALAIEAREDMKLRHAPLLLVRELARRKHAGAIVGKTLTRVIQRADELAEFLSIYWKDGKEQPIAKQVKLGLAGAFRKFDEYQFAKYDRESAVRLRDALFLSHARPKDAERHYTKNERAAERKLHAMPKLSAGEALYRKITDRTLATPDTWEVALSGGADKKEVFERLLTENKLGYMALLRNLRNMADAGVDVALVQDKLLAGAAKSKALPFRFVAAARAVPQWEEMIDTAMQLAMGGLPKMPGRTILLVDVSGSMDQKLSSKSDLTRLDAASALAVLLRGVCENVRVFTFSQNVVEVPARTGMALIDAIKISQTHGGTYLGAAVNAVNTGLTYDRLITITDEQSYDIVGAPLARGYMINVASAEHGVGYGQWTKIDGFSESIVRYIQSMEEASHHNPFQCEL